jgi:hypothetical protein
MADVVVSMAVCMNALVWTSLSLSQYSLFHWSFFVVGEFAIMSPNW